MLYATKDKLYVRTASGFSEVIVSVESEGLAVTKIGSVLASRPNGATPVLPCELIAQRGLSVGDVYPHKTVATPQPTQTTPGNPKSRK